MNRAHIFLAAYAETGSISKACAAAKIDRQMHYRRLKSDLQYKAAFEAAQEIIVESLEAEAIRRARDGVPEPVVFQGKFTYPMGRDERGRVRRSNEPLAIRRYSDSLLAFLLRGARPEKYRERFDHSVTATVEVAKFKGSMAELLATFRELTTQEEEEK